MVLFKVRGTFRADRVVRTFSFVMVARLLSELK